MERLRILAAAVALGQFTAVELAAYSGASEHTVRSVLRRDSKLFATVAARTPRHGEAVERPARRATGRPARQFEIADAAAVNQEIAALERQILGLTRDAPRQSLLERDELSDKIAAIDVALNSLCRAWATGDPPTRRMLSGTAVQTLRDLDIADDLPSTGTAVSAPSAPISLAERLEDSDDSPDRHAWAVQLLARLTFKEASGSKIVVDELCEAVRAASALLPKLSNSAQWGAFLGLARLARAGKQFPPVGILTPGDSTPADAVDGLNLKSWVAQKSPVSGHRFWLQPWAQSLADVGLISCVVVYGESVNDELVASVLPEKSHRVIIVVSRRLDATVVGNVAAAGAIFFPSCEGEGKLSDAIINNPLLHTISAVAESRPKSRWATEARASHGTSAVNDLASAAGLVNKKPMSVRT